MPMAMLPAESACSHLQAGIDRHAANGARCGAIYADDHGSQLGVERAERGVERIGRDIGKRTGVMVADIEVRRARAAGSAVIVSTGFTSPGANAIALRPRASLAPTLIVLTLSVNDEPRSSVLEGIVFWVESVPTFKFAAVIASGRWKASP